MIKINERDSWAGWFSVSCCCGFLCRSHVFLFDFCLIRWNCRSTKCPSILDASALSLFYAAVPPPPSLSLWFHQLDFNDIHGKPKAHIQHLWQCKCSDPIRPTQYWFRMKKAKKKRFLFRSLVGYDAFIVRLWSLILLVFCNLPLSVIFAYCYHFIIRLEQ